MQVEARIAEEAERARHYLDPSTESRITKVCVVGLSMLTENFVQEYLSVASSPGRFFANITVQRAKNTAWY